MNVVKFISLRTGYWDRHGKWNPATVLATVHGYRVRGTGNKGWSCECPDASCNHLDQVADLIAPYMLERIDTKDDRGLRPPKPVRTPAVPRQRTSDPEPVAG